MEDNKENKNKEHIKNVNVDVALKFFKIYFVTAAFSFLSYVFGMLLGSFDFGIIIEAFSFFMIVFASDKAKTNELSLAKKLCLIGMLPILVLYLCDLFYALLFEWELIYTYILLAFGLELNVFSLDILFILIPIISIFSLFKAYIALKRACNPVESVDFNQNFYDTL